jgi:hypothetical protein
MNKHLLITLCFVLTLFSVNFAFADVIYQNLDYKNDYLIDGYNKVIDVFPYEWNYATDGYFVVFPKVISGGSLTESLCDNYYFGYSNPSGASTLKQAHINTAGTGCINTSAFSPSSAYATTSAYFKFTPNSSSDFNKITLSSDIDNNINYAVCDTYASCNSVLAPTYTPPDYSSRIDSISVSTTTGKVNITGYWNTSTSTGVFQQVEFYQDSSLLGIESYATVNATTSGVFNLNFDYRDAITPYTGTTTAQITSSIMFYAYLYQKDNNYYDPFGELDIRYSTLLDATTTSLTASTTNAWELSTTTSILDYPEYECSITSITGCFKNAGIWLFYPSSDSIEKYNSFIELIQRKPPVGYFTIVKSSISGLSSTSTSAFSITIPNSLKEYFFNPMDAGIAGILWIYFLFMFYKRLKHIQL